jgi:hypothetical protein
MARNPTTWSNNDVKLPGTWSGVAKNTTAFTNNIVKATTLFTTINKENTAWNLTTSSLEPWLYDDATQKYDDTPVRGYDYLVPATNTINDKLPTAWTGVV